MDPQFWHFLDEHGLAVIICLTAISIMGLRSWMRASIAAQLVQLAESSLDWEQLEAVLKELSREYVGTQGMLEQFGRLSPCTQWGFFILAFWGMIFFFVAISIG